MTRLKNHADDEGWQRFFDTYGGVIYAVGLKAGLTPTEAEEALQETLVSVAGEMAEFHYDSARGSFKGWLFQITRRRVVDQFRKRARQQRQQEQAGDALDQMSDPTADPLSGDWDDEWRQNQLQIAIERVKAKVTPGQWQMFDLAAMQEWPMDRITSLLGVNRAQVYMAKMRVGRLLKKELATLPEV